MGKIVCNLYYHLTLPERIKIAQFKVMAICANVERFFPCVEFVVTTQHETSCDPEITTKEDADHRRKLIWFLQAKRS